jgi:hypothetical protein
MLENLKHAYNVETAFSLKTAYVSICVRNSVTFYCVATFT